MAVAHMLAKRGIMSSRSARTSATRFPGPRQAAAAWAASVLTQAFRPPPLPQTALAQAPPATLLRTLCKGAAQVQQ